MAERLWANELVDIEYARRMNFSREKAGLMAQSYAAVKPLSDVHTMENLIIAYQAGANGLIQMVNQYRHQLFPRGLPDGPLFRGAIWYRFADCRQGIPPPPATEEIMRTFMHAFPSPTDQRLLINLDSTDYYNTSLAINAGQLEMEWRRMPEFVHNIAKWCRQFLPNRSAGPNDVERVKEAGRQIYEELLRPHISPLRIPQGQAHWLALSHRHAMNDMKKKLRKEPAFWANFYVQGDALTDNEKLSLYERVKHLDSTPPIEEFLAGLNARDVREGEQLSRELMEQRQPIYEAEIAFREAILEALDQRLD
ncbi:hypothetical protein B9Z65_1160 [Elsinoe australis]|uniref:Uncharacterized protein n=1 Tax=Elsinoe australis TaxID=40998 RepID=A0A2P8AIG6_9PEZI|nr:hypothetical protein B9Z65_1160 [Elsinoe australis]